MPLDAETSCSYLGLCEAENFASYLLGERFLDLESHIETVNNSGASWKAGVNEKFANATYNQARSLMGTIVDQDWAVTLHEKQSYA